MNKEIFSDAMNEIDPKYVEESLSGCGGVPRPV